MGIFIIGLVFSPAAEDKTPVQRHALVMGMHYLFHITPPGENTGFIYFFINSRIGMDFEYLFNITNNIGLGAEIIFDADIISFVREMLNTSDMTGGGIYEFAGRAVFYYNASLLTIKPLFGIRYVNFGFLTSGYNLEAGLRLALPVSRKIGITAEGCYYFSGGGESHYPQHAVAALGVKFIF